MHSMKTIVLAGLLLCAVTVPVHSAPHHQPIDEIQLGSPGRPGEIDVFANGNLKYLKRLDPWSGRTKVLLNYQTSYVYQPIFEYAEKLNLFDYKDRYGPHATDARWIRLTIRAGAREKMIETDDTSLMPIGLQMLLFALQSIPGIGGWHSINSAQDYVGGYIALAPGGRNVAFSVTSNSQGALYGTLQIDAPDACGGVDGIRLVYGLAGETGLLNLDGDKPWAATWTMANGSKAGAEFQRIGPAYTLRLSLPEGVFNLVRADDSSAFFLRGAFDLSALSLPHTPCPSPVNKRLFWPDEDTSVRYY